MDRQLSLTICKVVLMMLIGFAICVTRNGWPLIFLIMIPVIDYKQENDDDKN